MRTTLFAGLMLVLACHVQAQSDQIARTDRAKMRETRDTMRSLMNDLRTHWNMHDAYPESLQVLVTTKLREALPDDAWGNKFVYEPAPEDYRLISQGADGKPGGEGAAADIIFTRDGELIQLSDEARAARAAARDLAAGQARRTVARHKMAVVGTLVIQHRRAKNAWPAALADVRKPPVTDDDKLKDMCFTDPWANPFDFKLLPHENFAVICYGADGKAGGMGDNADFTITEKEVGPELRRAARVERWFWRSNVDSGAQTLADAVRRYKERVGVLPEALDDLLNPGAAPGAGPVLNSIPTDRWNREYAYIICGSDEFYIVSLGKDGIQGGVDDDADSISPRPGESPQDEGGFGPRRTPREDQEKLKREVATEQLLDIAEKVNAHKAEKGNYPATLDEIKSAFPGETVPLDPWGRPFVYAVTKDEAGNASGFTVLSRNSDGGLAEIDAVPDIVVNEKGEVTTGGVAEDERIPEDADETGNED